jgi:hypothetical protein
MTTRHRYLNWHLYISDHAGIYTGRAVLLKPANIAESPEILKEFKVSKDLALSPEESPGSMYYHIRDTLRSLIDEYEAAHG